MHPKILEKTKTYLIGSIQYSEGTAWRNDMTLFLSNLGVTVFDPYDKPFLNSIDETEDVQEKLKNLLRTGGFDEVRDHMKKIRALDLSMVDRSDFIICYIDPSVPTYGTMEELTVAVKARKPVFTVVEGGVSETPLWLTAMMPREQFFNDFLELKNHLSCLDRGLEPVDEKYWRLLKMEYR